MNPHSNGAGRVNSYALVTYVPEPLGSFLDRLRSDLEPGTLNPRAHVTILPPRPLPEGASPEQAWEWVRSCVSDEAPFPVETGGIEVFPGTNVVYVSLQRGFERLRCLHAELNSLCLYCSERYSFHPHITLAQNLNPAQADELAVEADRIWRAYGGPRNFLAASFTFVQELTDRRWQDLFDLKLRSLAASRCS